MEKLDPKTDGATPNIVEQNIEELKRLFPEIVTEGKVDFDGLREVLGDYTDDREERYSFTWNGKSRARRLAQTPSTGTLRPCPDESVNWDTTQNLFIEGENLEVLKLLQKSYHRKIKMIYIDPPYNTGKEFIYPDDFRDSIGNYLRITGQTDEDDKKLGTNPETSGRYHTDWLNMMYPRLRLARNLLTDEGIIMISIDDNELVNLRKLCDEVFGEENFISIVTVASNPRGRQSDTHVASVHDYLVCYARSAADASTGGAPLTEKQRSEFKHTDEEGHYRLLGLRQRGAASRREDRPDMFFPIYVNPSDGAIALSKDAAGRYEEVLPRKSDGTDGRWMWGKAKASADMQMLVAKRIERRGEFDIFVKDYLQRDGQERTRKLKSIWDDKDVNNQAGTQEVKQLLSSDVMSYPKPVGLLSKAVQLGCPGDGIVLDFFAGSGTAAQAVIGANSLDRVGRRFIMVQLPETTGRSDFKTISDVCKTRIRRAIERVEEKMNAGTTLLETERKTPSIDLGFRVFRLATSNIKAWDAEFEDVEGALLSSVENVKPARSEADVLYELLLKFGLDLAVPMQECEIAGKAVHVIGAGALIVCLADEISIDVVEGIAALKTELAPETIRVIFKDAGFADDVVKTNAVQILHQASVDDVRSL